MHLDHMQKAERDIMYQVILEMKILKEKKDF